MRTSLAILAGRASRLSARVHNPLSTVFQRLRRRNVCADALPPHVAVDTLIGALTVHGPDVSFARGGGQPPRSDPEALVSNNNMEPCNGLADAAIREEHREFPEEEQRRVMRVSPCFSNTAWINSVDFRRALR